MRVKSMPVPGFLTSPKKFMVRTIEDVVHPAQMPAVVQRSRKGTTMLYTIVAILVVLWLLGMLTSYTMGGFIHVLLVIAVVVFLFNLLSGRKTT